MAIGTAAMIGGGALLGGIAGSQQDTVKRTIGGQTGLGAQVDQMFGGQLSQLQGLVGAGAGESDVRASTEAQREFAEMLKQMAAGGFLPGQEDFATARGQAQNIFAGQRAGLDNAFTRQTEMANQEAARLGRSTNDPILQAQLRRQGIEQERELLGQETALTQQIASSLPLQRLGFAQQRVGALSSLGGQAFQNRQSLLGAGTNIQSLQNQIRLGQITEVSGGGMKGALTGALGGAGAGMTTMAGVGALGQGDYGSILNK